MAEPPGRTPGAVAILVSYFIETSKPTPCLPIRDARIYACRQGLKAIGLVAGTVGVYGLIHYLPGSLPSWAVAIPILLGFEATIALVRCLDGIGMVFGQRFGKDQPQNPDATNAASLEHASNDPDQKSYKPEKARLQTDSGEKDLARGSSVTGHPSPVKKSKSKGSVTAPKNQAELPEMNNPSTSHANSDEPSPEILAQLRATR